MEEEQKTRLSLNIDLVDPGLIFSKEILNLVNDFTYFEKTDKDKEDDEENVGVGS